MTAALPASPPAPAVPVGAVGEPPRLLDYLRQVPDPRQARGKRHPLAAILLLVVVATLAGRTHRLGMHEWGREAAESVRRALAMDRSSAPLPNQPGKAVVATDLLLPL